MAYGSKYEMEHRKMSYNLTKWDFHDELEFWHQRALKSLPYNPKSENKNDPNYPIIKQMNIQVDLLALVRLASYRYYQIRFLGIDTHPSFKK